VNVKLKVDWFYGTLIIVLSVWILQSFLLALLVACVTAVASWPMYRRFARRMPSRLSTGATPLVFTAAMTVIVLAPLTFAVGALVTEVNVLLLEIAAADEQGIAVPSWVERLPFAGAWLAGWWHRELAQPGALLAWTERGDMAVVLGWAQALGQFMVRHLLIILFTILVLFFLYQRGESLSGGVRRMIRHRIGERADHSLAVATRALRASVSSMLVVALFDGFAAGVVYAIAGVPHAAVWAAITGALALVPFLGYVAVVVVTLQLAVAGGTTPALLSFWLGCAVLFCGDKIVRPAVARDGTRLPFVWVLMGCLGGFEVLGLVGVVIGPVVLTLAREFWEQHLRDVAPKVNEAEV
jgi:predicted PurR-regulated permease PerM